MDSAWSIHRLDPAGGPELVPRANTAGPQPGPVEGAGGRRLDPVPIWPHRGGGKKEACPGSCLPQGLRFGILAEGEGGCIN